MANYRRDAGREGRWRELLAKHASSGLGVRAFCRREKVAESNFYAWRRTIGKRDQNDGRAESPAFLPAVVTASLPGETPGESPITIELSGGRLLRLPESTSAERLADLVHALETRGPR
jgi:transposase-like protein